MSSIWSLRLYRNTRNWLQGYLKDRPRRAAQFEALSEWYRENAGYRKYGLIKDDLIIEEWDVAEEALSRLSEKQIFDRAFRISRATQLSMYNDFLPRDLWTKPEEDKSYLLPIMLDILAEREESEALAKNKLKDLSKSS